MVGPAGWLRSDDGAMRAVIIPAMITVAVAGDINHEDEDEE